MKWLYVIAKPDENWLAIKNIFGNLHCCIDIFKSRITSFLVEYCKEFKNFNSMFAILSGLNTGTVSRLHNTWEKLPSKYQKMFDDLLFFLDPTRNMSKYRNLLNSASSTPPVVCQSYPSCMV